MKFKSRYKSLKINTGKGIIVFKDGEYSTDDREEMEILKKHSAVYSNTIMKTGK